MSVTVEMEILILMREKIRCETHDSQQHQMVDGMLQCTLMGFANIIEAIPDNPLPDLPHMTVTLALQSIRGLEDPGAARTFLDDCESLLYLVCWLGTLGVNKAQRAAYVAGLPEEPNLPIMDWNQGTTAHIARHKRNQLATEVIFCDSIVSHMPENSPLRPLALDMYRALFLHPGCYGTTLLTDNYVAGIEDGDIHAALHAIPVINGKRDPLVLRYAFLVAIIANVLG
ncbi:hypothetical protein GGI09_006332, partial [Coemansia sp. S100]